MQRVVIDTNVIVSSHPFIATGSYMGPWVIIRNIPFL